MKRRTFLETMVMMFGGITLAPAFTVQAGQYDAWKRVNRDTDPMASMLNYHEDAIYAPRVQVGRPGAKPCDQFCNNCQFAHSTTDDWTPCSLFPGKTVSAYGWCSSWTLKTS